VGLPQILNPPVSKTGITVVHHHAWLAEEISRCPSTQTEAWLLLAALARFIVRIGSKKQSRKVL
jgi:hypothetical protein